MYGTTNPIYVKVKRPFEFILGECISSRIAFKTPQGDIKHIDNKPQYTCTINGQLRYLPIHQELVDFCHTVPKGTRIRAERLTKGNSRETARYKFKIIEDL